MWGGRGARVLPVDRDSRSHGRGQPTNFQNPQIKFKQNSKNAMKFRKSFKRFPKFSKFPKFQKLQKRVVAMSMDIATTSTLS